MRHLGVAGRTYHPPAPTAKRRIGPGLSDVAAMVGDVVAWPTTPNRRTPYLIAIYARGLELNVRRSPDHRSTTRPPFIVSRGAGGVGCPTT